MRRPAARSKECSSRMLEKSSSSVLASLRGSIRRADEGTVPIRSHVIEASGSSEAWYVDLRLFAHCGLACGTMRLGASGWVGETGGLFEHPAKTSISALHRCPQ